MESRLRRMIGPAFLSGHSSFPPGDPGGVARAPHPSLPSRLQQSPGDMSTEFLRNFLPVGKDFTIPTNNFLPVGNGLRDSPAMVTKRHAGRDAGHKDGYGRYTAKWRVPDVKATLRPNPKRGSEH